MLKDWTPGHILFSIVLLGFIQGAIYMLIIPPWWHYDEPGHFEYAWLAANRPGWPEAGQYDQGMRRQVADSLIKYGWYKIRNFRPDLSGSEPIVIGVPQVGDAPGYYFLASLPLRFMGNANIIFQYYAVRSISFLLYLLIIAAAWYALGEILPKDHPLRWMVPAFIALLPAFVDTMTAVNNDVSAVAASSLFLWASLKMLKQGYSIGRLVFLAFTLILCYFSKSTAWFTFLLTPLVLFFSVKHGEFIWMKMSIAVVIVIFISAVTLQWGAPLAWYQNPISQSLSRTKATDAVSGHYIFKIDGDESNSSAIQLIQFLTPETIKSIKGKTVTLGAYIWASQDAQVTLPYINITTKEHGLVSSSQLLLSLGNSPAFYSTTIKMPNDAINAVVYIYVSPQTVSYNTIFADDIILAIGDFSNNPPKFTDQNGSKGEWDDKPFTNLIRNASAEQGSFTVRPWVGEKVIGLLANGAIDPPLVLSITQDPAGASLYYRGAISTLFRTFWASLAGDKVVLPSSLNYLLLLITVGGVAGTVHRIWKRKDELRWDVVFFMGASLVMPWALALTRGIMIGNFFSPWARYGYPAILPTALLLCAGWLEWLDLLKARFKFTEETRNAIFIGWMVGLSIYATMNAIQYFYPAWGANGVALALLILFQVIAFYILIKVQARLNSGNHAKD